VAQRAGSFTHRDRRIEFPAGLQHTEAKDQQLSHSGDHDLLSFEAPLLLEPVDESSDDRIRIADNAGMYRVQAG